ncbi:MAG TPA: APC family permease [Solirubrobacteraceae bacterium]|nr:APC family permease [Solirubrobacteraceae bacterium]
MASISSAGELPHKPSGGVVDKGLKKDAIGYLSNLVIGVASTAPAYSLAVTLGFIVAVPGVGVHAPAVLIVSFIPMLLIAGAYRGLNRADPDAGTTFAWATRALGPGTGWVNGWTIFLADVIVMASLADIAAIYTFKLFGFTELGESKTAIIIAAVIWIVLMTWICWRGIELSARVQQFLLSAEILILGVFSVVALSKVYGSHPAGAIKPEFAWFNPFAISTKAMIAGVLLGVFIYWGWDSGVTVNEESEDSNEGPGRAAVLSTILLVLIYVVVSASGQAFHGTGFLEHNSEDVLNALGKPVLGGTLDKLLIIAVLTSASASTQTTILPTARTTLSMAYWKAIPRIIGRVHPRFKTPDVSTIAMGAISIAWTVAILIISSNALEDAIIGLGFPICFYYGFTGLACVVYYRKELTNSVRDFVLLGLAPLLGAAMLAYVFVEAVITYRHASEVSTKPILGITLPLWIGIGGILVGVALMLVSRPFFKEFFSRKTEVVKPGLFEEPVEHAPARF